MADPATTPVPTPTQKPANELDRLMQNWTPGKKAKPKEHMGTLIGAAGVSLSNTGGKLSDKQLKAIHRQVLADPTRAANVLHWIRQQKSNPYGFTSPVNRLGYEMWPQYKTYLEKWIENNGPVWQKTLQGKMPGVYQKMYPQQVKRNSENRQMNDYYKQGFMDKCAQLGVAPAADPTADAMAGLGGGALGAMAGGAAGLSATKPTFDALKLLNAAEAKLGPAAATASRAGTGVNRAYVLIRAMAQAGLLGALGIGAGAYVGSRVGKGVLGMMGGNQPSQPIVNMPRR